jgi:RNA polymerase sigma-70 factor (ECF subfamily)
MTGETESQRAFTDEAMGALDGLYRFAVRLTGDPVDAEDLVQDTYLIAYQRQHQYQLGTNCKAWLFTICRHHWLQQLGRAKRVSLCNDSELEVLVTTWGGLNGVGEHALRALMEVPELGDVLEVALNALPHAYKMPVVVVDIEDQSYSTAAEILGVPVGTVRSRLHRGRKILQKSLLRYAEDAGFEVESSPDERAGKSL